MFSLFASVGSSGLLENVSLDTSISVQQIVIGCLGLIASWCGLRMVRGMWAFMSNLRTAVLFLTVSVMSLFGWVGGKVHNSNQWDSQVGEYVVEAAKTSEPSKAKKYFQNALAYLDQRGATEGSTAVLYPAPADDISEWYEGLKSAADEVEKPVAKAEETGWRAKLLKSGIVKKGTDKAGNDYLELAKYPSGISLAPYNAHFAWGLCGIIFGIIVSSIWTVEAKKRQDKLELTKKA